jgi:glutathione S-transferase
MDATPVLWHLEISHYNEKARWALDYKGVAHVRRAVTPGLQELTARRLRAGRTVPVLKMNGRAIGDSTKIIEEIERRWPAPPLYPADPEECSRALKLEDYFDDQCGPDARRVLFNDNLAEPETFLAMFLGADRRRIGLLETLTPLFFQVVKRRFRIRPETVEKSRERVRAAFEKGECMKLHPDERTAQSRRFRDSLKDRPGFKCVEDVYARHRGTSAEVAAEHRRARSEHTARLPIAARPTGETPARNLRHLAKDPLDRRSYGAGVP